MKRTKIICTIGPASEDPKKLAAMASAGMNVARLNFSHGTYANHARLIRNIRVVSQKLGKPIAIMQDLQGPKIRVAALLKPFAAKTGETIVIGQDFKLDFDITGSVKAGQHILIEDGLISLKVVKVSGKKIICKVANGGLIQSHKGVNLPETQVKFPIFTDKDRKDLQFGLKQDVDFVALSFVRTGADLKNVKRLIKQYNPKGKELPKIIAKIERAEAIRHIDEIIRETDLIMVARGDLGVEIAESQVPLLQKSIINKCIQAAKPVIVATQMLDSMINNPRPTRAEVSDVANAVIDKADAVMLSGETASGKFPIEAVTEMSKIIVATERSPYVRLRLKYAAELSTDKFERRAAAISESVYDLARAMDARAIIGTTESGFTARFISHQRPAMPILILTDRPKIFRQMCATWGVRPLFVLSMKKLKDIEDLLAYLIKETHKLKLVKRGDKVVLVAGNPLGQRMNLVEIVTIG